MWKLAFRRLSPPILLISSHQLLFNHVTAPESSPCSQKEGMGTSTVCWHFPLSLWPPVSMPCQPQPLSHGTFAPPSPDITSVPPVVFLGHQPSAN